MGISRHYIRRMHSLTLASGGSVLSRQMVPRLTQALVISSVDVAVTPGTSFVARVVTETSVNLSEQRRRF